MKKLLTAACALTAGMLSFNAEAQERWPRWYVGLSGGLLFMEDEELREPGGLFVATDSDTGGVGAVALGYMIPTTVQPFANMRVEAELGYRYNKIGINTNLSANTFTASQQTVSYMANAYYDFRNPSRVTPYVGIGTGVAQMRARVRDVTLDTTVTDNSTFWAYQAMAGLAYSPTTLPNTDWTIGYRFFQTRDSGEEGDTFHSAEAGARFRF